MSVGFDNQIEYFTTFYYREFWAYTHKKDNSIMYLYVPLTQPLNLTYSHTCLIHFSIGILKQITGI